MATPSFSELKTWAENYTHLWNAGDKQGWIDSYRKRKRERSSDSCADVGDEA